MPRRAPVMSAAKVRLAKPGRYCDGGATGLYLLVRDEERKFWIFRYSAAGKKRETGLGAAVGPSTVTLVKAREKARALYEIVREGRDPIEERANSRARQTAEAAKAAANAITFGDVADRYIDAHESTWRNPKHRQQWRNTLQTYVRPTIGAVPVAAVGVGEVMAIVEPLWRKKPETAGRVRGRIETILDYAKARNWRDGENPARWRGHLENLLPARGKVARVKHHAALPWRQVGGFMARLAEAKGMSALALRFIVLTASRSGEVRGARWNEIDLDASLWVVPRERMKSGQEHRVPLSKPALKVLHELLPLQQKATDLIFPGGRKESPLSDVAVSKAAHAAGGEGITVHGFRSCFRDWVAEATGYPRELAEKALAHALADKVEAAYQRGDLFEKRARLMADWAEYCSRPDTKGAKVVGIREARS